MLCFVNYVMFVDKDVVEWKRGVVVDCDDCGWWCVLRSIGCGMDWVGVVGKM